MNPSDWNPLFVTFAGLGLLAVVIVALAELVSRRTGRAQTQRAVWIAAATLLLGLTVAEWFGARVLVEPIWTQAPKAEAAASAPSLAPANLPPAPLSAQRIAVPTVTLTAQPLLEATTSGERVAGWLALVWMGGVALLLARCGLALGLLPLVRRRLQPVRDTELLALAKEVRERLGLKRTPELRQGSVASPMAFGLFRPVVCLPEQFVAEFPPQQQRAVLAHEFAHVASLDALWRCVGEVLAALLWWHPAVWLVRRRLHSACEFAADEASRLTGPVEGSLAEALVALAAKPGRVAPWPVLAAAGDGYHSDLGQRVERLLDSPDTPPTLPKAGWRWSAGALLTAAVLMTGLSACRTGGESPAKQAGEAFRGDQSAIPPAAEMKPQDTNLITRVFKVDPNTLVEGLGTILELQLFNRTAIDTNTFQVGLKDGVDVHKLLRNYFTSAGVDLTPPKAVFFNDRSGLLMARATAADLELLQTALDVLNVAPPQIMIETKWIEITDEGMKVLAMEWPALNPHPVAEPELSGVVKATKLKGENPTIRIESEISEKAAILTPQQAGKLLKSMEGTKGTKIVTTPKVTTLSGRQAQVAMLDLRTVVTGMSTTNTPEGTSDISYDTTPMPFGPSCDLIPYVEADGFTLNLTVIATESEFIRYDDPEGFVPARSTNGAEPIKGTLPLPRMRIRYFTSTARIWDGQSLLLGGLKAEDEKEVEAADGTKTQQKVTKHLFVLITPTIVDPAGNRMHSEEDIAKQQGTARP